MPFSYLQTSFMPKTTPPPSFSSDEAVVGAIPLLPSDDGLIHLSIGAFPVLHHDLDENIGWIPSSPSLISQAHRPTSSLALLFSPSIALPKSQGPSPAPVISDSVSNGDKSTKVSYSQMARRDPPPSPPPACPLGISTGSLPRSSLLNPVVRSSSTSSLVRRMQGRCLRCGDWGHRADGCRNARVCFICGKLEHLLASCPIRPHLVHSNLKSSPPSLMAAPPRPPTQGSNLPYPANQPSPTHRTASPPLQPFQRAFHHRTPYQRPPRPLRFTRPPSSRPPLLPSSQKSLHLLSSNPNPHPTASPNPSNQPRPLATQTPSLKAPMSSVLPPNSLNQPSSSSSPKSAVVSYSSALPVPQPSITCSHQATSSEDLFSNFLLHLSSNLNLLISNSLSCPRNRC